MENRLTFLGLPLSTRVIGVVLGLLAILVVKEVRPLSRILASLFRFYAALAYFFKGGKFADCPESTFRVVDEKCHIYSLYLMFQIWDKPHYRNGTFQHDMIKNLRNVAIPGTGLPLSIIAKSKILTFFFVAFVNPLVCLIGAIAHAPSFADAAERFEEQLLRPRDWFSLWRLNCRLATHHANVSGHTDYSFEDKLKFLNKADAEGIPVTPRLDVPWIVCKHRNEEGGLGFVDFVNANDGGDWIIQPRITNDDFISSMLPSDCPLSTFRVISASKAWLKAHGSESPKMDDISALSCVWRAGREGASTDHSCIMFNVDPETGIIQKGTTSKHWYKLGPAAIFTTPWTSTHDVTEHPDTGKTITGTKIERMEEMMTLVRNAHLKIMPHVPLCGWDVAFTREHGILLLEVNISCNFFRGTFDHDHYFQFVSDYFQKLEAHGPKVVL